jgi:hypothetical protein
MLVLSIPVAKIVILKGNRKIAARKTGTESSAGHQFILYGIFRRPDRYKMHDVLYTYLYPPSETAKS